MKKHKEFVLFPVVLAAALTACGGDGTTNGGNTGAGTRSVGTVTRSGNDIYVNGTVYDTANATVIVDGQDVDESMLQNGMVVTVNGTTSGDGATGSASHIEYDHELKGAIESKAGNAVVVLGQTVLVDGNTQYQGAASFDDLMIGDRIEVSGHADSTRAIHASYIERESGTASETEDLEGEISGLTQTTFNLNGLTVDYQSAQVSGELAEGAYVEVEGDAASGGNVMTATRVEVEEPDDESAGHSGNMELEGYVTGVTDGNTFEVDGQPVEISEQTVYEAGKTFADIALDVKIEVEGTVDGNGVLLAAEISFE